MYCASLLTNISYMIQSDWTKSYENEEQTSKDKQKAGLKVYYHLVWLKKNRTYLMTFQAMFSW